MGQAILVTNNIFVCIWAKLYLHNFEVSLKYHPMLVSLVKFVCNKYQGSKVRPFWWHMPDIFVMGYIKINRYMSHMFVYFNVTHHNLKKRLCCFPYNNSNQPNSFFLLSFLLFLFPKPAVCWLQFFPHGYNKMKWTIA